MKYEFGGSASFAVWGVVEVPEDVDPRDFARTTEGKAAIREAFAEWWETTDIKFRDADLTAECAGEFLPDDGGSESDTWDEVEEL